MGVINMSTLKVIPIPVSGKGHPQPKHSVLPTHEFVFGVIAPPGSGKTNLLCNMLLAYKGYFHNIVIVSPSINNDEKWDYIKKQKLIGENKALKKFLKELQEESDSDDGIVKRPKTEYVPQEEEEFCPYIPEENFLIEYDEGQIREIWEQQKVMCNFLKKHGQTKHLANRLLIIFDDMVGSTLFSNARDNFFKMMNANRRHKSLSMMLVSQGYREIPKTIRTCYSCLILFEIMSDKEIESILEEYPMGMKKDAWLQAYQYCVEGEYNFLYYNMMKKKGQRVMKNFDDIVTVVSGPPKTANLLASEHKPDNSIPVP